MKRQTILLVIGILLAGGLTISAQMDPNMKMDSSPGNDSDFSKDMKASMKKMHHDMMTAPMTGNVDHDFVAMMLPHHQGAVDMAEGEIKYGKDPAMLHLAQKIVTDQNTEIDEMNRWLKDHPSAQHGN